MPLLAKYYIDRYNREFRKRVRGLTPDALAVLEQYRWPGNVRELRNAIERAMLLRRPRVAHAARTSRRCRARAATATFQLPPEGLNLEEVERQLLVQALDRTDWNQTQAGQLLGINRDQVRYRIEKFGLRPQPSSASAPTAQGVIAPGHALCRRQSVASSIPNASVPATRGPRFMIQPHHAFSDDRLLRRVHGEFMEMPGLRLTRGAGVPAVERRCRPRASTYSTTSWTSSSCGSAARTT